MRSRRAERLRMSADNPRVSSLLGAAVASRGRKSFSPEMCVVMRSGVNRTAEYSTVHPMHPFNTRELPGGDGVSREGAMNEPVVQEGGKPS